MGKLLNERFEHLVNSDHSNKVKLNEDNVADVYKFNSRTWPYEEEFFTINDVKEQAEKYIIAIKNGSNFNQEKKEIWSNYTNVPLKYKKPVLADCIIDYVKKHK